MPMLSWRAYDARLQALNFMEWKCLCITITIIYSYIRKAQHIEGKNHNEIKIK